MNEACQVARVEVAGFGKHFTERRRKIDLAPIDGFHFCVQQAAAFKCPIDLKLHLIVDLAPDPAVENAVFASPFDAEKEGFGAAIGAQINGRSGLLRGDECKLALGALREGANRPSTVAAAVHRSEDRLSAASPDGIEILKLAPRDKDELKLPINIFKRIPVLRFTPFVGHRIEKVDVRERQGQADVSFRLNRLAEVIDADIHSFASRTVSCRLRVASALKGRLIGAAESIGVDVIAV